MLNKWFPLERNCFALILPQGLQLSRSLCLCSLKTSTGCSLGWKGLCAGGEWPGCRRGALHCLISRLWAGTASRCSAGVLCISLLFPLPSQHLSHSYFFMPWSSLSNTQTVAVLCGPCAPWKPGCRLEAWWALWECAWDRSGACHLCPWNGRLRHETW